MMVDTYLSSSRLHWRKCCRAFGREECICAKTSRGISTGSLRARLKALTLGEVYREFVKARKPHLKPRTLYDYDLLMHGVFKDWRTKPITDIRKTQVSQRHRELGEQRGEAYANQAMRFLRAMLNFAHAQYDDGAGHSLLLENPVRVLTQTRSW